MNREVFTIKLRAKLRTIICAIGICAATAAHADSIVDRNVRVTSLSVPSSQSLSFATSGALTVTVTDLAWTQTLQSLSFAISDHDSVLARREGTGSLMYDIATPGSYFANVFATPNLFSGVGLYHLNVSFMPTVVPLPAAAWLLVSGIFVIFRLLRRSSKSAAVKTSMAPAARVRSLPFQFGARRRNPTSRAAGEPATAWSANTRNRTQKQKVRAKINSKALAHTFVTKSVVQ